LYDEEIVGAAGRIEDANLRHVLAKIEQSARIIAGFLQLFPDVIRKSGLITFRRLGTLV